MNKQSLKDRIKNLSKEMNLSPTLLYVRFFFDAFLERLVKSKYTDNFVLKGGLYLSSLVSVEKRATMDMDFLLRKLKLSQENIINCVKEIINIDNNDDVNFDYISFEPIRENDIYGGISVILDGHFANIKQRFSLDFVTGDPIINIKEKHTYKCLLTNKELRLNAYSIETFVAEKLETILSRKEDNGRSKDFYDVYIIEHEFWKTISFQNLRLAFKETCVHRLYEFNYLDALNTIKALRKSVPMHTRWEAFASKTTYANGLAFDSVLDSCEKFIDNLIDEKCCY